MADPSSNLVHRSPRPWRLGFSWLFGLLILAAVVVAASHFTEIERFGEIARAAQPAWLFGAFGLQAMTYVCAAGVWYAALKRAGIRQSFWAIVPLGLAKLFTDQALPTGGIGGTFLVVNGLARRGVPKGIAMAALLIGMISFYAAYLIAAAVALVILYYSGALDPLMVMAAAIFVLVALGVPASVLALRQWSSFGSGRSFSWLGKWLRRIPGVAMVLSTIASVPGGLLKEPTAFLWTTALQLLVFALDSATLWIMLHAVGAEATASSAIAAFMMASIAATIGPMPLGLGTFEGVCITVLHIQGLSVEVALTATLLLRGFTFWLPMIPGLLLARRELHPSGERGHASCSGEP